MYQQVALNSCRSTVGSGPHWPFWGVGRIELVGDPRVLLVDEGTSGLDASHALRVMRSLKRLAHGGTTVVVTVHQPRANIFRLFDSLLLLHKGKPVYCGAATAAIQYFGRLGCACPQYENPVSELIWTIYCTMT